MADKLFGLVHYNLPATLVEFLDYVQATGFDCVEVQASDVWEAGMSADQALANAPAVQGMLAARHLAPSAFVAGNDFLTRSGAEMEAQVERMNTIFDIADALGTKTLRMDGGWAKAGVAEADRTPLIIEGFRRIAPVAEARGFTLALDNHGTTTNDADLQIRMFGEIGSPVMGANLDTMNYRWFGHDIATIRGFYERLAPWVRHTHFKDGRGTRDNYVGTVLGEGEIPLEYAIECLKDAGYAGPWLVEYEGPDKHREGYARGLAYLKAHV